jgi:hypothetical protein
LANKGTLAQFCPKLYGKFRVILGEETSTARILENGVVQGAVLSVTLFMVAMSQITQNVALPTKIIGYADDWVVYT